MVTGELKRRGRVAMAVLGTQQVMMGAGGGEEIETLGSDGKEQGFRGDGAPDNR